jgi:hypothetical protein
MESCLGLLCLPWDGLLGQIIPLCGGEGGDIEVLKEARVGSSTRLSAQVFRRSILLSQDAGRALARVLTFWKVLGAGLQAGSSDLWHKLPQGHGSTLSSAAPFNLPGGMGFDLSIALPALTHGLGAFKSPLTGSL